MVAGQKIRYLTGTKVLSGGYMHGWITTSGQYCSPMDSPAGTLIAGEGQATGEMEGSSLFRAYPNPSSGEVTVEISQACQSDNSNLELYGPLGEKIMNRPLNGEKKPIVSLRGHAKGVYFIRISTGTQSSTAKIILQ